MPAQFTSLDAYKSGDVKTALVDVFHRMDELLNSKEFAEEVKDLRGMGEDEDPMGDPGGGDPLRMFIKRVTEGRAWVSLSVDMDYECLSWTNGGCIEGPRVEQERMTDGGG